MKKTPLYLIESFLAFTSSNNMQEAAKKLGLSQPALTAHLKSFQDCFGEDVFANQGRRKILTAFGQQLNQLLEGKLLNLDNEIQSLINTRNRPEEIKVKVAGRREIISDVSTKIDFNGHLIYLEMDGLLAAEGVKNHQFDIAISNHAEKFENLHAKKLFKDQFSILYPAKWKINENLDATKVLQQLLNKPYLSYKENDQSLELICTKLDVDLKSKEPHRVISNWNSIMQLVEQGQGWALAPDRYDVVKSVSKKLLDEKILNGTQFYILYRKESIRQPWFNSLVSQFQGVFN